MTIKVVHSLAIAIAGAGAGAVAGAGVGAVAIAGAGARAIAGAGAVQTGHREVKRFFAPSTEHLITSTASNKVISTTGSEIRVQI